MILLLSPAVLKADGIQGPLVSLGSSSSEQPSTSKQQYSVEQQLYGASGSREDIFTLGGPSYMTSSKSCSSRSLGYGQRLLEHRKNRCAGGSRVVAHQGPLRLSSLPAAGRLHWTVNRKAQETPISPCQRRRLHSQSKVGSASYCLRRVSGGLGRFCVRQSKLVSVPHHSDFLFNNIDYFRQTSPYCDPL